MFLVKNKKSPFYQLVIIENKKRTTVSTETKDEKEAIFFMASYLHKKNNKEEESISKIEPIILSKFKDEYLEYLEKTKSKSYIRSVKLSFKMLMCFCGDCNLHQLKLRTIDQFISTTFARTEKGAALYYRSLKAAFSKAVAWEYADTNFFKLIKLPKMKKAHPIFITEIEFSEIINHTKNDILRYLFKTAFLSGLRLGELVNMRLSWVNFNESQITTICSDGFFTKNKVERTVPINQKLLNDLKLTFPKIISIKKNDYVFTLKNGIKLNEDYVSKQFKKAVRAAELNDKIHFHSLRHSYASILVQRGVPLKVIQELLGHENFQTTEIYAHLQQQTLRDAVNLL